MRLLKAFNQNQIRFSHKQRQYSLVDLHYLPVPAAEYKRGLKTAPHLITETEKMFRHVYPRYHWELADVTTDHVEILGRFETPDDAFKSLGIRNKYTSPIKQ